MNVVQFLSVLSGRRRIALAVVATSVAAASGVTLLMPEEYTASATVMLDVRSPEQVMGGAFTGMLDPTYRATQLDLISSERVVGRVIESRGLARDDRLRGVWLKTGNGGGDFNSWLTEAVQRKIALQPARSSNVIGIGYSASTPTEAADMANAFVRAYIDTALEVRVEPIRRYESFFEESLRDLRVALETAQSRLSSYQNEHGLIATDEKQDVENMELVTKLTGQVAQMQALRSETEGRRQQARSNASQLNEVLTDPVVSSLNTELAREESRGQELRARFGDRHPQLVEQNARIAEMRSRLATATAQVSGSIAANSRVTETRLADASAALAAQRDRVLRLKVIREQAAILQRDVDSAQRAYDAMQQRAIQSRIEGQNTTAHISVLKQATPPMYPSSPKWLRNIAIGLAAGIALGLGSAWALEFIDRRLRTSDDVNELRLPLIVLLPAASARPPRVIPHMEQRLLAGLPPPHTRSA
jgi:chain length determinant protein EpsF